VAAFTEPHRVIKRLKARIERIAFSPIDPPHLKHKGSGRAVPTNSGFTISHIGGITGAGCLVDHGNNAINA
jgi:hypothetical protein